MQKLFTHSFLVCLSIFLGHLASAQPIIEASARFHPVVAPLEQGMVVAQDRLAAQVGAEILSLGGNAVDAAVATGFALAVTFPQAGNIGGGGFMMIYLAETNETIALDYREIAPGYAHRDLFIDVDGQVDSSKSRFSIYSAGVPGTVAGLVQAQERYGALSLETVMAPAIKLADDGFVVGSALAYAFERAKPRLSRYPASREYFLKETGESYRIGDIWRQPDLAKVLQAIAEQGREGFYAGDTAEKLIEEWRKHGAELTPKDLQTYRAIERTAIKGQFGDFEIASMPPPSSGGVHLVQMLNVLSQFNIDQLDHNSADYIHLLVEVMKFAYADRSRYLGDPDFFSVPVTQLISASYAKEIADRISLEAATPSSQIHPGTRLAEESTETTHYSVWDADGNVVSNTYTLNFSFGSGIAVAGAGFLLNNEMDDFSAAPGVPNAFGLVGDEANMVEPYKRPLSSMTPTILFEGGKPVLATGSPGGSTIITTVLQVLLNVAVYDMNVAEAVAAPRIHHQWLPDFLRWEDGISRDTLNVLSEKGHEIAPRSATWGKAESIFSEGGWLYGATDPRWPDSGAIPGQ